MERKTVGRSVVLALAAAFAAGCADGDGVTDPSPLLDHGTGPNNDRIVGHFEVCKFGTDATFEVWVDGVQQADLNLTAGSCAFVATVPTEGANVSADVTVEEVIEAGMQLQGVTKKTCIGTNCSTVAAANPVSGTINNDTGIRVEFTNVLVGGGEGCTPGYWKTHTGARRQADAWPPTGLGQGDSFDATFGVTSSFGGTLLEALERGGGGEAALGRHAVAALLNALHPDVSYALSAADVISLVQNAYATGDFETAKDTLEQENEEGCPL